MSTHQEAEVAYAKVYDEGGRTVIPKRIRHAMGIEPGDELQYINFQGDTVIYKVENDEE